MHWESWKKGLKLEDSTDIEYVNKKNFGQRDEEEHKWAQAEEGS